jgi:hypothetical protein
MANKCGSVELAPGHAAARIEVRIRMGCWRQLTVIYSPYEQVFQKRPANIRKYR